MILDVLYMYSLPRLHVLNGNNSVRLTHGKFKLWNLADKGHIIMIQDVTIWPLQFLLVAPVSRQGT